MASLTPVIEHPDFLLLDEELDADTLALRDRVRSFALEHVEPVINDHWERAEFPYGILPALRDRQLRPPGPAAVAAEKRTAIA